VAIEYGLALARAELDWLDSTREWLSERPLLEEDDQSDGDASGI